MDVGLAANLKSVQDRIASACNRAGRSAESVRLVAVSKTQPCEVLQEAIAAGVTCLGENKVQEAEAKIDVLGRNSAEWHLIGHLQSNKARKAVKLFDVIQTLDSAEMAFRLDRICAEEERQELKILIQVDLAGESTKSGAAEIILEGLISQVDRCERLRLCGLMTIPPFFGDPEKVRPYFARLRGLRDEFLPEKELSMGMSGDFEVAIEEGATLVRVGTAIFGERIRN